MSNNMAIMVTGAGGFIGSHLIDALVTRGENVTAVDIYDEIPPRLTHLSKPNLTYEAVDVRNKENLSAVTPKNCKMIFHLAAIVGVENYYKDPLKTIDVNIGGLRNIIDIALSRKSKIVFTSTSEIYGKNATLPWTEESDRIIGPPSIDRWSYSNSKAICEHMLFAIHRKYNLPVVIVRPFNTYGPRQSPIFAVPAMICSVLAGKRPVVYDSGKRTRCFTFVDDFIQALLKASENQAAEGQAINIGSTHETTVINLARMIIDIAGKSGQLEAKFINTRDLYNNYDDIDRRIPDVSKAKTILGWEARTQLHVGLKKTIDFFNKL